ncbi:MAG: hypothetical protein AB8B72_06670 [Crocinitomicaceae bacterium]
MNMTEKIEWVWIYTGPSLLASFLKTELLDAGILAQEKSDTNSALTAGFGTSGHAQVYVDGAKFDEAQSITTAFEERQIEK